MSLAAGSLNRRITLQRRAGGVDAAGQPLDLWDTLAVVWANIKGQTGMVAIKASGNVDAPLSAYSFRIRYRADISEDMRVQYGATTFRITNVRHDLGGHAWTDIVCETTGP